MANQAVCAAQSAQSILTMFDERLQRQALASFERSGVEVRTGVRVVEVTQDQARPPWQQFRIKGIQGFLGLVRFASAGRTRPFLTAFLYACLEAPLEVKRDVQMSAVVQKSRAACACL